MERECGYSSDPTSINRVTFDELVKMSPKELESLRQREVEALINNAPERIRHRLRGLQFEVDAKRRTHHSTLGSCIAISHMMRESLERLKAALEGKPLPPQAPPAKILSFPNRSARDRPGV